ncbi:Beta-glucuronosyltransferase GlcAT14A [Linum perenne]
MQHYSVSLPRQKQGSKQKQEPGLASIVNTMGVDRRWLFVLFSAASISLLFLVVYSGSAFSFSKPLPSAVRHGPHYPPAFAYYISGSRGDGNRILRLLLAVYHPRNRYLLHLSADASDEERLRLIAAVNAVPAVRSFGNVEVLGKPNRLSYMGASHIASILRAAAILLRLDSGWNWFIVLSAVDYPLVTQDDLSYVFSSASRDLNFIDHSSDLGWKESDRFQPIVVDPGIYLARRTQIFYATEKRTAPDAFKIFTGNVLCSPWVILSRPFIEFCIIGWDSLPRVLLMYFNNVVLSEESYFQSVICNAPDFKNTTVNNDLRFMVWDNPPKMEPHFLNGSDYELLSRSGAAFARQFHKDDPVLEMIDEKILHRGRNQVVPGGWCTGRRRSWWIDPCSEWGDVNLVKPGPQAKRFEETISNLRDEWSSQMNQCKESVS